MKYGLGIDTGGTYTDAVIYDFENNLIIGTAKSITIKEDLRIGINKAIEALPVEAVNQVRLVSLSTTLATNACVEGKGSRAKLVLINCHQEIVAKHGHRYGLPDAGEIIFLGGGHGQNGELIGEPDWDYLKTQVDACKQMVDSFAVVELWGLRNAAFEMKAKELLTGWTGLKVVCGHELTDELNSLKRAASAMLNAQLIPIIDDFLNAIKNSLAQHGIEAPLVIVRGDGSLMSEAFSRDKPVETLLCGPAASIAGGSFLSGEKNCLIVDMGGTTSDLAIVKDGIPKRTSEGATVGKWRTGIKSIQIQTVGLGGDSLIRHNAKDKLTIGPVRAAPLSWAASRWPDILDKIKAIFEENRKHTVSLCEFLYGIRDISGDPFYTAEEIGIARALQNGPLSISELADVRRTTIYELKTKRLEQLGIIMRCGLTPTDIMHLTGDFSGWNKDAAYFGAMIMALQIDVSLDVLIKMVHEDLLENLYCTIIKMLLADDNENLLKDGISGQLDHLLAASFRKKRRLTGNRSGGMDFLHYGFTTDATLVGIGAPIHIYLPDIARIMNAKCVIPENAGVANAIGAITGNVVSDENIIIKPQYSVAGITGYIAFSPAENRTFIKYQESVAWAKGKAAELARSSAMAKGADQVEVSVSVYDDTAEIAGYRFTREKSDSEGQSDDDGFLDLPYQAAADQNAGDERNRLLLETVVSARAVGKIKW